MPIHKERMAAQLDGDFVVFFIGMRVNQLLRPDKWVPVTQAMGRMLPELYRQPELGFLHAESMIGWRTINLVQYWRSFDHLHAYAHSKDKAHLPAWAEFNRRIGQNGAVGIFHESYLVKAGQYECVYSGMPRFGLARAGQMVPAVGRLRDARTRLGPG